MSKGPREYLMVLVVVVSLAGGCQEHTADGLVGGGSEAYQVEWTGGGRLGHRAHNPAHGFQTTFAETAVLLKQGPEARQRWSLGLHLQRYGYEGDLRALRGGVPEVIRNRVEYLRSSGAGAQLSEWYLNSPKGLKQGFTLDTPPAHGVGTMGRDHGPMLVLEMALSGDLVPRLRADRQVVVFSTTDRRTVVVYKDLYVHDADGRKLPAHLALEGSTLSIMVEDEGAAYPVTVDPLITTEDKLTASDAAGADEFGFAISLSGDTALIGARGDDIISLNLNEGSAYVFVRSGTQWSQQAKLTAGVPLTGVAFGSAVSLSNDTAVVGAPDKGLGYAYVFARSGTGWGQQVRLTASDADVDDGFGKSVSISGDTLLVGAYKDDGGDTESGSAFVFVRSGTTWAQQKKLVASDGDYKDWLGYSVSLSGDTAVVGAYKDDDRGIYSGSAYVFARAGTTWYQQRKLTASDGLKYDNFGKSVSISGAECLIGADQNDERGEGSGAAYLFARTGATWAQQKKLTAGVASNYDQFGSAVFISGDTAVVGAIRDNDGGSYSGSAYVFVRGGTTWYQSVKLTAGDTAPHKNFGRAVSLSGDIVGIGAPGDNHKGGSTGAAYIYLLQEAPDGAACSTGSECSSGHCVEGVCCAAASCASVCTSCAVPGMLGTCSNIPAGQADTVPAGACAGTQACDGQGVCKKADGQTCSSSGECGGGICQDGTCCGSPCTDTCKSCAVSGSPGVCTNVPAAQPDLNAAVLCAGTQACDGQGACKSIDGQTCAAGSQCVSGYCVDGRCCEHKCSNTCTTCNLTGKEGKCTYVPDMQPDLNATTPCSGARACDGKGHCRLICAGATCTTEHCADGQCCKSACKEVCRACNVTGKEGTCSDLPAASQDPFPAGNCTGTQACDGKGSCKKASGQACAGSGECATGFCVDTFCCETACAGVCLSCSVSGNHGACTNIPAGQQDTHGTTPCIGTQACDGTGVCKKASGQACALPGECATGFCADAVCCAAACTDTCMSCALPASLGTCAYTPAGQADPVAATPCAGVEVCDGQGTCKKANGQACTTPGQCSSGFCANGYCCDAACTATGKSCAVPGSLGKCVSVPNGQPCATGSQCGSGNCVDGRCCDSTCTSTCMSCAVPGSLGACVNIPASTPDTFPTGSCTGTMACDGKGACRKIAGQPCSSEGDCVTANCVDGLCCNTLCKDTCKSCAVAGSLGVCTDLPAGQQDTFPSGKCAGSKACDGKGGCMVMNGYACTTGGECMSGLCVDGVCCESACTATCMSCAVIGGLGKCSNIPAAQQDNFPPGACTGANACDGKGACKKAIGQACTVATECGSGLCVEGYCCDSACTTTCWSCAVSGRAGTCSDLPIGQQDNYPIGTCSGTKACFGKGACKKIKGQACAAATECGSGYCVEGYCCDSACTGTCKSCALTSSPGTCSDISVGQADNFPTGTCTGAKACDGHGKCKAGIGQTCKDNSDCANNTCADGVCCKTLCNGNCMSCNLATTKGTCAFDPVDTKSPDCLGKDPACGGKCDGKGNCDFPGVGLSCGTCEACDGTGRCFKMPTDDTRCGVIDCDQLDTKCRDYKDLKVDRCDSFGKCKPPNNASTCTSFTDVCGGDQSPQDAGTNKEAGASPDQGGVAPGPKAEGCDCNLGRSGPGQGGSVMVMLLLLAAVFRRRAVVVVLIIGVPALLASGCQDSPRRSVLDGGGDPYQVAPLTGVQGYLAHNPAHGLRAVFADQEVRVMAGAGRPWSLGIRLTRYGYLGALKAVKGVAPLREGNRVEYWRGAGAGALLQEWYSNGPRGIKQGFTLEAAPARRSGKDGRAEWKLLVLEMALSGNLIPRLRADRQVVVFSSPSGQTALVYKDLYVHDAGGRPLPAHLSLSGSTLAIEVDDRGAAYPVTVDPLLATEKKLTASDAAERDYFGLAVSISGDTAVAGAYGDDDRGSTSGSAYVFVRSGTAWSQQAKLTAGDGAMNDSLGKSVSVSGDTAVAGSDGDDDGGSNSGSAYVFVRSGSAWSQQARLTASDAAKLDQLGISVAVSGDTAVAGAHKDDDGGSESGSAYVFVRNGSTWSQQAKLTASDAAKSVQLGRSVSISGDTALVGTGYARNAAYVFMRSGSTWSQQAKLTASDAALGDNFGTAVSINGDAAVVGSENSDGPGGSGVHSNWGAAYVFARAGSTWSQQAKLTSSSGVNHNFFGRSVFISGDTAVASATKEQAVYVFMRVGSGWFQSVKLTASDGAAYDQFGSSVSISGDSVLAGANGDQDKGSFTGSAYIYHLQKAPNGAPCNAHHECASVHCVEQVCCATASCPLACTSCAVAGSKGTCSNIPAGHPDNNPSGTCSGAKACDGAGVCKKANGQACTGSSQCVSGHCVDGVCCDTACTATSKSCVIPGSLGQCIDVPNGQPCTKGNFCGSGICMDGRCCGSACTSTCMSCAVPGSLGTCANVPATQQDTNAAVPCSGTKACDGKGACKKALGQACSAGGECLSNLCVDGYCCDTACTELCKSCAMAGSLGKCANLPAGQPDMYPSTKCSGGFMACDGKGGCKMTNGQHCKVNTDCANNSCVDFICCGSACTATCKSCAVIGGLGTCSNIPAGQQDSFPTGTCSGSKACDGKGVCKKAAGQTCAAATECGSGLCVEGYCCDSACTGTCRSCAVSGKAGTCSDLPIGQQDNYPIGTCSGTKACFGEGACKTINGQACAAATECGSGHCVDGVCCDSACTATCKSCAVSGSPGTCGDIPVGQKDDHPTGTCTGTKACDGHGKCKAGIGQACKDNSDCANNTCVDGVCCKTPCAGNCMSCNISGSVGTCAYDPPKTKSKDCLGKDPACGGECDGKGSCDFPGVGLSCGTCKACDGTGRCFKMPADDAACGIIDCDQLDTPCRDYQDLKVDRCASFGKCKVPNSVATCTVFTDVCGGAQDAGPGGDSKANPKAEGCDCTVGRTRSGTGPGGTALVLLLLLGAAASRRKAVLLALGPVLVLTLASSCQDPAPAGTAEGADAAYEVVPLQGEERYLAHNPAHGLRAVFVDSKVQVLVETGAQRPWSLGLRLKRYGYAGGLRALRGGAPLVEGNRVAYSRSTASGTRLMEWYLNSPDGLKQGFTLEAPPARRAGQQGRGALLALEMALSGDLVPRLRTDGQAVVFSTPAGRTALVYKDLMVYDARGRPLPAHLSLSGATLSIRVDSEDAVFPITVDPLIAAEKKLTANDAAAADMFGSSVSLSGDTALVGATGDKDAGNWTGSAYVFVHSGTTWNQQAKLTASDAATEDFFGISVSHSGGTAVVGAHGDDDGGSDSGAAYVFARSGTAWGQQAKLTASDAAATDQLGYRVSLSGDTAVVVAPGDDDRGSDSGAAYVFVRTGAKWHQQAKLTASDAAKTDYFGWSVSLSGDTALVGAPDDDDGGKDAGSAYVFVRGGITWGQQAKLTASDAAKSDNFGRSVSLSGVTAVVGTPYDDDRGNHSGSAYVFVGGGTTWSQQQKLTASDAAAGDLLGCSVSLSGDKVVVGTPYDDDGGNGSGSAYVFMRVGTTWSQQKKLTANDAAAEDSFGLSVSLSGDTAVVGASGDDDGGSDSGSAYIYLLQEAPYGTVCTTAVGCSSGHCVDGYCCDSTCTGTCKSCGVTGDLGKCSNIPGGQVDTYPAGTCAGTQACDGKGVCRKANGQACASPGECGSGHCMDAVCCDSSCTETCKSCALSGSPGTCTNVPATQPDVNAAVTCAGIQACDGKGVCKKVNGQTCTGSGECVSGHCADGYCCEGGCSQTCKACDLKGSEGKCTNTPDMQPDTNAASPCTGTHACDGMGACHIICAGATCSTNNCVDGACCDTSCTGTCKACHLKGKEGTCSNIPHMQPDTLAIPPCSGTKACDGQGACHVICAGATCATDNCVDGTCCNTSCTSACMACNVMGKQGKCSHITKGGQDTYPTGICSGTKACDGAGLCKKANGQTCTAFTECATGICVDTVCCQAACTAACMSCSVPGSLGACAHIPAGQQDTNATTPCTGTSACDGAGGCKKAIGQACLLAGECATGFCADKVCCTSACLDTCKSCAIAASLGTCTHVSAGVPDPTATSPCFGTKACDGKGSCKKANGQTCTSTADCGSGLCVEGFCCDTACSGTCRSCAVSGSLGTCTDISAGGQDTYPAGTCAGTQACDGKGSCKKANGQSCVASSDCGSGHCVEGYCCDGPCTATCKSCAISGSQGACGNIPAGQPDTFPTGTCVGTKACNGSGACKAGIGQTCTDNSDCANNTCVDGVCCKTKCATNCMSCNLSGSVGTCAFDPPGTKSKDCLGKDPACGGKCDGKGSCDFPGVGLSCGTCKACDGTGRCFKMPSDDTACGVIDCDQLDTKCRDYKDLKVDRCEAFGKCKASNNASTCTSFTDVCGGDQSPQDAGTNKEAGPHSDQGGKPPGPTDEGCDCNMGRPGSAKNLGPTFMLTLLLLLGTVFRGRRSRR